MKTTLALLACGLFAATAPAEYREFTSAYGQKMKFELLSHDGTGKVVDLRTESGEIKKAMAINAFSKVDQEFILEWMKKVPAKVDYHFRIAVDEERIPNTDSQRYDVRVTNAGRTPVGEITVKWRVSKSTETKKSWESGKDKSADFVYGSESFQGPIASSRFVEFKTKAMDLSAEARKGRGFGFDFKQETKHKLAGIQLQIIDSHGKVIGKYSSQALEDQEWKEGEEAPEEGAGRRGGGDAEKMLEDWLRRQGEGEAKKEEPAAADGPPAPEGAPPAPEGRKGPGRGDRGR